MHKIFWYLIAVVIMVFSCNEINKDNLSEGNKLLSIADHDSAKFRDAIALFKNELKNNPESRLASIYLANAYSRIANSDSAIIVLTESIKKYKNSLSEFYQGRGMNYFILKNFDASINDFEKAIQYDGTNHVAYKQLVLSNIYKAYNKDVGWLNFTEEDIKKIIEKVYPYNMKKPSVAEFNSVIKTEKIKSQ